MQVVCKLGEPLQGEGAAVRRRALLDAEHKKLFAIINELHECLGNWLARHIMGIDRLHTATPNAAGVC